MRWRFFAAWCALASVTVTAHAGQGVTEFDVASVKRSAAKPGERVSIIAGARYPGGRWRALNATLSQILGSLYGVRREQIINAPPWFDVDKFVIDAKASDPQASADQLSAMAKQLLAERFALRLRIEQRPLDIHALVVARPGTLGPGMRPSTCQMAATGVRNTTQTPRGADSEECATISRKDVDGVQHFRIRGHIVRNLISMHMMESIFGTPVVDRTGLTGSYDYVFEYVPQSMLRQPDAPPGRSLITALEEQLGLLVQRRREPMDVVIIESAQQPDAD